MIYVSLIGILRGHWPMSLDGLSHIYLTGERPRSLHDKRVTLRGELYFVGDNQPRLRVMQEKINGQIAEVNDVCHHCGHALVDGMCDAPLSVAD